MNPNVIKNLRLVLLALALTLPLVSLIGLGSYWLWQNGYMIAWAIAACAFTLSIYGFELWMLRDRRRSNALDAGPVARGSVGKRPAEFAGGDIGSIEVAPSISRGDVTAEIEADDINAQPGSADTEDTSRTTSSVNGGDRMDGADPMWSEQEHRAWAAVQAFSAAIDPASIGSRQAVLDLGLDVVTLVAQSLHPGQRDPVLHFTVPEGLALVEQVSRRLRPLIVQTVPLGDQITIGQAMRLYQWRSVLTMASKGYDLWRLIRILNPLAAATQEVREQVTKKIYDWGREAAARKLLNRYIEEVGRAAIDLYAGRLKVSGDELSGYVTAQSATDMSARDELLREPLRVLIGGQVGAGKSSLINALSQELAAVVDTLPGAPAVTTHLLQKDGVPLVLALDLPGLASEAQIKGLIEQQSQNCDLVLWVLSADRADRDLDLSALRALSASFAAEPERVTPPILLVMSHIDRLRPLNTWQPPYDWHNGSDQKSRAIASAREAICTDLNVSAKDVIPVFLGRRKSIEPGALKGIDAPYNIEGVWQRITEVLPGAKAARLSRTLKEAAPGFSWRRLGAQTLDGARGVKKTLWK